MRLRLYSAAGNRFALLDQGREGVLADASAAARALCGGRGSPAGPRGSQPAVGEGLDGLILASPPRAGGDARIAFRNADGSRPEACGNGLRAAVLWLAGQGLAAAEEGCVLETDVGARRARLLRRGGEPWGARVEMGEPTFVRGPALDPIGISSEITCLHVGNPHCVIEVEDLESAPVETLGPAIERHPGFSHGTNVEFAELRGDRLALRVWERGVGETAACGTGACAAAAVAVRRGHLSSPVEVDLPGGRLTVEWDGQGELWLSGPCEGLGELEWSPAR